MRVANMFLAAETHMRKNRSAATNDQAQMRAHRPATATPLVELTHQESK